MGERIPPVDPDLKGAVASAVGRLKPIYAPLGKIVSRIKSDKCLKELEEKLERLKNRPVPTREDLRLALSVWYKAKADYAKMRVAEANRKHEIWEVEEEMRNRVELLSKMVQKRAVERLRTTLGLKFLDAPLEKEGRGRTEFRKLLARSEKPMATGPLPPRHLDSLKTS